MAAPPRSSGRSGALLLSTSSAGVSEDKASLLVAAKIDSLQQSCERVRLEGHEALPWSGLLDDFSALNTSLRLLRDSVPANFNALAIAPHEIPTDLSIIGLIPDLLSTFPGEDGYEMVEQLVEDLKRRGLGDAGILIPQDSQQLRLKVHTFNRRLDQAREVLQQAATESRHAVAEVSKITIDTQPLRPKAALLRKDYETLYNILSRLYRTTGLKPTPLDF